MAFDSVLPRNSESRAISLSIKLLKKYAPQVKIYAVDSKGIISGVRGDLNDTKRQLLDSGVIEGDTTGALRDAVASADVFIGVSKPGVLTPEMVHTMASGPIIFALANPTPEIMPSVAKAAGAAIVATGRSDFPNQINNALAFPGIFRGALDHGVRQITDDHKIAAAETIASLVQTPTADEIIPSIFTPNLAQAVAAVIV
jgi:malate dehydrogenase (oxaloacetate-decarboxylating)